MKALSAILFLFLTVVAYAEEPWAATQKLENITGLKRNRTWEEETKFYDTTSFPKTVAELPKKFDWRDCAPLPPVNRQAYNDCWAQGSVGVVELLAAIHGELKGERGSVQAAIDCSGAGSAANGGYWAYRFMTTAGLPTALTYPYRGNDGRCRAYDAKWKVARYGNVGARGRRPTAEEVKQAIYSYGPVGTTIYANGALQRFRGAGVFTGCGSGGTNHIEVITGWETDANGRTIWNVRNSWGESHGDKGYAKIPHGCSRAGDEDVTFAVLEKF